MSALSPSSSPNSGLTWFIGLSFGLLWLISIPAALAAHGIIQLHLSHGLQTLASFAPCVAAISVSAWTGGRQSLKALFSGIFRVRVSIWWYAFALLLPLSTHLASIMFFQVFTHHAAKVGAWSQWMFFIAIDLPICLLGEEIGWRGFFFDRLSQRLPLGLAVLSMALVWGLWHLPIYLAQSSAQLYLLFLLGIIPVSALLGFLYHRTRSVLLCALLHASLNAGVPFWIAEVRPEDSFVAFGVWIIVLWVATIPVFVSISKTKKCPVL